MSRLWPAVAAAAACAVSCAHPVRFGDRAILWRDADDAPVPMPTARRPAEDGRLWPGADNAIFRPAERLFTVDYGLEAVNVNALDEVPASTWYDDPRRNPDDPAAPPRALTAAELLRGARTEDVAEPPFVIRASLEGGSAVGFVVEDARGRRFALKLDPAAHPGLVSGADAVATRLAWASGWRVPADDLLDLARDQLRVAPDATRHDHYGRRRPLGDADVDAMLGRCARAADGRYRAVASRWIAGHVLGPMSWLGRDRSDGNDRYAHENRRDLRGFGVWAAWVDDVDVIENNTLDSYVGEPGRGHVVHYQLDVGGSFGGFSGKQALYWMGDQTYFQAGRILGSLMTLGALPYRWEDPRWQQRRRALLDEYPEFGGYSAHHFEPRAWRPIVDIPAFVRQTRRDRYWGAKRVAAFSRQELAAVVAAGGYRPEAAAYLAETLWHRRTRIALDAFAETAALDYVTFVGDRLCFVDLWVRSGLGGADATEYRARMDARDIGSARGAAPDGTVCMSLPRGEGYEVVTLAARRPGERRFGPAVDVHFVARGGHARLVGLAR